MLCLRCCARRLLARAGGDSAPRGHSAGREFLDSRLHRGHHQRRLPARRAQSRRGLRHAEVRRRQLVARSPAPGRRTPRPTHRRAAPDHRGAADRGGREALVGGRQTPARAVGSEPQRDPSQGCDATHPLPARPGGSLQGRPDPLLELGSAHRRDLREPGTAARARRAAARRVVVQRRGVFEGGRRRPVAVHALHRPALHARRRRGRRAPRSVPLHRSRRPTTGLQLPRARQLAAGAHGLQPRRRRHAPRQGIPSAPTIS